jgi:hypothetical protein
MNNLQALSHNRAAEAETDESDWRSQLIGSLPPPNDQHLEIAHAVPQL